MTARVKVDVRECVGVVCGCGCGVGVVWVWVWVWCVGVVCGCGISMSPYCMLDGVRQGRRDI